MSRVEKVLGIRLSLEEVCRVLSSLGFQYQPQANVALLVTVPYWRSDIAIEDDLVEELARIIGYDAIPTTFLSDAIPQHQPHPMRELRERVRDILAASGMQEVISYSLTSRERLEVAEATQGGPEPLRVANPMSPEQEYLRTTLRPNILATLASNQRSGQAGLRLFEVGKVYHPRQEELPEEREMAIGVLWGDRTPLTWTGQAGEADFFDGKGVVEALLAALNLQGEFTSTTDPLLHPGKTAAVMVNGQPVGVVGEVLPDVLERFDVAGGTVVLFELDMELLLLAVSQASRRFVPLARFPGSYRDMALLVDTDVPASRLEAVIRRNALVESVTLFDVYAGPGVPQAKRSLAFRIHYQSGRETLTAEAVNAAQEQILQDLERETDAKLRG